MNKKALWTKIKGAKVSKKKPPKPLKRISKRQTERRARYLPLRNRFLKLHPICQVCMREEIRDKDWNKSVDVHHRKGRVGQNFLDTSTWMAVCRPCHDAIHRNPKWAYERGYLSKRV